MELPIEAFPPLVPSSLRSDKRSAKTRPQATQYALRKQKTRGQKKKTLIWDNEENVHPVMRGEDHSPSLFEDSTPTNLTDVLQHIHAYSTRTALDMGLTCSYANELMTKRNTIWKGAINKDYDVPKALPGISTFHHYHFLCTYKGFEGRYIFNKIAHIVYPNLGIGSFERNYEIKFMDIDVTSTGFTMSFLKRAGEELPLEKCKPFLEAKLVPNDKNGTDFQLFSGDQANPYAGQQRNWQRKDFLSDRCTLEQWLFTCTSLYSAIVEMIDGRHLVQVHLDGNKHLDPRFQSPAEAWPRALPKPGVFHTQAYKTQVIVSYFGGLMVIEQLALRSDRFNPFGITIFLDLGSAATVQAGETNVYTRKEFMDVEKNTDGDPAKFDEAKDLYLTDSFSTPIFCRAWYTSVSRKNKTLRLKAAVFHPEMFSVITDEGLWILTRQSDTE